MRWVLVFAAACSSAQPSRWEPRSPGSAPDIVCTCDGVEREPRPHEASTLDDPRIVKTMCEGKVRDCRPVTGRGRFLD